VKKSNFIIVLSILLAFIFLVSLGANKNARIAENEINKSNLIGHVHSSNIKFDDEEIFGYADLVAIGKIVEVSEAKYEIQDFHSKQLPYIYKDYFFEITKDLKGDLPQGEVVTVRVPGGEIGKHKFVTDSISPGTTYRQLLYLKEWNPIDDNKVTYTILGGPQGKYELREGKAVGFEKSISEEIFLEKVKGFKEKYGNKVVLPPGVIK